MRIIKDSTRADVLEFAREHLREIWHKSGSVLYSGYDTLDVGDVYLLGTNPGGSPEHHINNPGGNIGPHMEKGWKSGATHNCYWDERWGSQFEIGRNPLQRRVRWLLCELSGCECGECRINNGKSKSCLGKKICASNLIFLRSVELAKLETNPKKAADLCWGVHDKIISDIVQPKVIVIFGKWPYDYLRKRFPDADSEKNPEEIRDSNHATWKCRRFMTTMIFGSEFRPVWIFSVPHLSRYAINNLRPDIADWIKEKLPLGK